jgi:hypothetical protein
MSTAKHSTSLVNRRPYDDWLFEVLPGRVKLKSLITVTVQSLAIAASPSWAAALESSHRFFGDWPITMPAEPLVSTAKLRTEGSAEQNRVAVVCKGEAAIASACISRLCSMSCIFRTATGRPSCNRDDRVVISTTLWCACGSNEQVSNVPGLLWPGSFGVSWLSKTSSHRLLLMLLSYCLTSSAVLSWLLPLAAVLRCTSGGCAR